MNLAFLALRIAAVEAIKGGTLAGDNVLDSEIAGIETDGNGALRVGQEQRFVAVYTQSGKTMVDSNAQRPFYGAGQCELIFEMAITKAMNLVDEDTGTTTLFQDVPATDAAFEFYLGTVGRQVMDCLSSPTNEWAQIWRDLCPEVRSIELNRASGNDIVRLAGHQIKMVCSTIEQPIAGHELDPEGGFAKFLTALENHPDDERKAMAVVLQEMLAGNTLANWEQISARLGMDGGEAVSIGIGSLETDDGSQSDAQELNVEVEGLGTFDAASETEQ